MVCWYEILFSRSGIVFLYIVAKHLNHSQPYITVIYSHYSTHPMQQQTTTLYLGHMSCGMSYGQWSWDDDKLVSIVEVEIVVTLFL